MAYGSAPGRKENRRRESAGCCDETGQYASLLIWRASPLPGPG
jgi:hypothetical protein